MTDLIIFRGNRKLDYRQDDAVWAAAYALHDNHRAISWNYMETPDDLLKYKSDGVGVILCDQHYVSYVERMIKDRGEEAAFLENTPIIGMGESKTETLRDPKSYCRLIKALDKYKHGKGGFMARMSFRRAARAFEDKAERTPVIARIRRSLFSSASCGNNHFVPM